MELDLLANMKPSLGDSSSIFCFELHSGWNWNPALNTGIRALGRR